MFRLNIVASLTIITHDLVRAVFKGIYDGLSTTRSIKAVGLDTTSFYHYMKRYPELVSEYACARETRADIVFDEMIDIADTELDAAKARNRIDARKHYASKMQPHKYGDRLDVNVTQQVDISTALADAKKRAGLSTIEAEVITKAIVDMNRKDTEELADEPLADSLQNNIPDIPDSSSTPIDIAAAQASDVMSVYASNHETSASVSPNADEKTMSELLE